MTDQTRRSRRYPPTDIPVRRGYHPKWVSCFPGGVHRWDDGSPDPEDDLLEDAQVDAFLHDEFGDSALPRSLDEVLREMGF